MHLRRSARSARETSEKVADSIRKSGRGAHLSGKVASSLLEIAAKAREVDETVAEIAVECGFYDHSAFTRAFRAAYDLIGVMWLCRRRFRYTLKASGE